MDSVVSLFGSIMQDIVWGNAPDGKEELQILKALTACARGYTLTNNLEGHRENGYSRAKQALMKTAAYRSYIQRGNLAQAKFSGTAIPANYEDRMWAELHRRLQGTRSEYVQSREGTYRRHKFAGGQGKSTGPSVEPSVTTPSEATTPDQLSLAGTLDYFVESFQYRYVAMHDYLDTFAQTNGRGIDLMLASMVDYDWWLAQGKSTRTSLPEQVAVMEQISVLSHGQVHGFVPFDPLREVAFKAQKRRAKYSSLALVQDAILNRGCIGVKLYPPMGFAPYGNSDIWPQHPEYLKLRDLPTWTAKMIHYKGDNTSANFGQRLDEALAELYSWCCSNEVPIMAHSHMSNGGIQQFDALAGAQHWEQALTKFPKLRISFGHLGDFPDVDAEPTEATKFVKLMGSVAVQQSGMHAYGDAAYYSDVINNLDELKERFISFYTSGPGSGTAVLPNHMMYGSDWNLLLNYGDIKSYLEQFVTLYNDLDNRFSTEDGLKVSERFFGYNAVDWIGLRKPGLARQRLETFYARNGINTATHPPGWTAKVDISCNPS
ncbi:MAG TPA: hypothetical protein VKV95_08805 [Terriglobia bacterium]|nr:hypothetical protein [Terriglobia bacterium]